MESTIFEEMGGTYRQEADYLLPNLTVPESTPLGIWGQHRRIFLRKHRQAAYATMLITGKLEEHLAEADRQAKEMLFRLVEQFAKQEGITEQFKEKQEIKWTSKMNNIRNRVFEIILTEIILHEKTN